TDVGSRTCRVHHGEAAEVQSCRSIGPVKWHLFSVRPREDEGCATRLKRRLLRAEIAENVLDHAGPVDLLQHAGIAGLPRTVVAINDCQLRTNSQVLVCLQG